MPTAIPSPILGSESKSLLDAAAGNTTTGVARSSQVNSHRPVQLKLDLRERPVLDMPPATYYILVSQERVHVEDSHF